jgi:hypothetical protein
MPLLRLLFRVGLPRLYRHRYQTSWRAQLHGNVET